MQIDARLFKNLTKANADRIARYVIDQAPSMVVRKVYRFIDGNFRAQGWQGRSFQAWKANQRKGTILVKSGALRRSINHTGAGAGAILFYTNVKYAAIHNRGGTINKDVTIRQHTRKITYTDEVSAPRAKALKYVKKQSGEAIVKSHVRRLNLTIPQRQFMPYEGSESPVLNNSIIREINQEIVKILTK